MDKLTHDEQFNHGASLAILGTQYLKDISKEPGETKRYPTSYFVRLLSRKTDT